MLFTYQVTAVLVALVTFAANCWVLPMGTVAAVGETATVTVDAQAGEVENTARRKVAAMHRRQKEEREELSRIADNEIV
jgi:hypothetical protein